MVPDSSGFTHAAGGKNDLGLRICVNEDGFFRGDRQRQSLEPQWVDTLVQHRPGFLVKVAAVALQENPGSLHRQGRVHIHWEVEVSRYQSPLLDFPDGVEHFLGSAHGEGGNHQIAAPVQGPLDTLGQLQHHVAPLLFVVAVTVGGFNHQILGRINGLGVIEQGLICVAHVAAEYDFPGLGPLCQPQFDCRRSQQMTDVGHADINSLRHPEHLPILAGPQQLNGRHGIDHGVSRFHQRLTGPFRFPAAPLSFRLLDVGRVPQHNVAQIACRFRSVNRAGKSVLAQLGQHTGVVNVGVGQKHRFNSVRRHRQGHVLEHIHPLLHTAVHQVVPPTHFQQGTAACYFVVRTDELDLHT